MAGNPKVVVDIITDASKAGKGIDEATGKFGAFNSTMSKLAGPAAAVLAGITAVGAGAVNAASDLEQAAGGVDSVFGKSAKQIHDWASTASDSVGLSAAAYSTFAAQIGAQFKNLGVPMDQVGDKTNDLITKGADLAAAFGGSTSDAVNALGSALRGEADPAERYGLKLNAASVNAELAAKGLDTLTGAAYDSAKAQTIMEMITAQMGDVTGQAARESDTLAGAQQALGAKTEDAAAALGTALLPILAPLVQAMGDLAKWVQQNASWLTPLIGIIAAVAAAVLAYTAIQWALNAAMLANPIVFIIAGVVALVAAFVWLWNNVEGFRNFFIGVWDGIVAVVTAVVDWFVAAWSATMTAFQTGWEQIAGFFTALWTGIQSVVGAVAKWFTDVWNNAVNFVKAYFNAWGIVIGAIIKGVQTVVGTVAKWFTDVWKNAVTGVEVVIKTLQGVFTNVFNAIMGPIRAVIGFFNQIVSAIQNVINWLGRIKIPDVFGAIGNFIGGGGARSAPPAFAAAFAAPPVFSGRSLAAVPSGGRVGAGASEGTVINVNGGLDSADTIARRIAQLLAQRDRRAHGVTITRSIR